MSHLFGDLDVVCGHLFESVSTRINWILPHPSLNLLGIGDGKGAINFRIKCTLSLLSLSKQWQESVPAASSCTYYNNWKEYGSSYKARSKARLQGCGTEIALHPILAPHPRRHQILVP